MDGENNSDSNRLQNRQNVIGVEVSLSERTESSRGIQDQAAVCIWKRLQRQRNDLGEWLIDQATDVSGDLTDLPIDACLGGDDFVPCSFRAMSNGRRFQIDLVSTAYTVVEIEDLG
jgi:hypothetical protein